MALHHDSCSIRTTELCSCGLLQEGIPSGSNLRPAIRTEKEARLEKDARKYRKSLEAMVKEAQKVIAYLELIGKATTDNKAGSGIAHICNTLEYAADYHRHFALGQSLNPKRKSP